MPGVVQQYVEAVKEVDAYAQEYDQHWDVRQAYEENLWIERQSHPGETYGAAVRQAIEITKHEIKENADTGEEERVHEHIYYSMRERGYSPKDVGNWMNERIRENPKIAPTEMLAVYQSETRAYSAQENEAEPQGEARAQREGLHINQFHSRYESPTDASEYTQNLFAEQSEEFVERQLRTVDRQFPDATEVERLQITEDKLGLDHQVSERILAAYNTESATEREGYRVG